MVGEELSRQVVDDLTAALTAAPVALGQPSPDPAPVSPTLAPDPAPAAATPPSSSPPSSSPPATEAPAAPAPATPVPTTPTAAPQQSAAATADAAAGRSAKQDRRRPKAEKKEPDGNPAEALPRRIAPDAAFLKVTSLLPQSDDRDDSSSSMLFLAAAGLLVLAIASGSFASVLARLMPPTAVLLVLLAMPAAANAENVTASCATPSGTNSCNQWYSSPWVTIQWNWDSGGMILSGCSNGNFMSEGPRIDRSCRVRWGGTTTVTEEIWIGIDRTAPQISGLQTARPADFGSWFNHPVALSFEGSDGLSGIASCTSLTYSGPEGAGAPVNGSCTDVAGNTRSSQRTVNYDATAPPKPNVVATPRDGGVRIEWTPAADAQAEVMRVNGGGLALVYSGTGHSFTDNKLKNEERYRYVVSLIDQAGNRASAEASAVPTASPLLTPSRPCEALVASASHVAQGEARELLQRAASPWQAQDSEPVAADERAPAQAALALRRQVAKARRGPLLLVRLAGVWRSREAQLRAAAGEALLHSDPPDRLERTTAEYSRACASACRPASSSASRGRGSAWGGSRAG